MPDEPIQVIKDSKGHRSIYIPSEGLRTPKPIPNLDIKSSGPIYPTTLEPLYKNKFKDKSILYRPILNID